MDTEIQREFLARVGIGLNQKIFHRKKYKNSS